MLSSVVDDDPSDEAAVLVRAPDVRTRGGPPDDVSNQDLSVERVGEPLSVTEASADGVLAPLHGREIVETTRVLQGALHSTVDTQSHSFSRITDAFVSMARSGSPADLVNGAPAVLCDVCEFDRAMISRVRGSTWVPTAVHVEAGADDEVNVALAAALTTLEIPLTSSLIETEMLRKRISMLVDGTAKARHTFGPLAGLTRSRSYVAAPIVIANRVVGFLHADRYSSRRKLTAADRVALETFAGLFGLLYERTTMAQHLTEQRLAIRRALAEAANSFAETDSEIEHLVRAEFHASEPAASAELPIDGARCEDGKLSAREWEVLGLLATGATNGQIAAALVVSESTVKSHVKRILHKLPAANRAEAVYRYTRIISERSRVS